ncbi:MAG: antibiotic biosynthesis monooxygenase family protein [Novosphingobium sp.]
MDLEIAILEAKDGDAAGLVRAMNDAGSAHLLSAPGCRSVKVLPGVENPGNVLIMVEWDSVEAHGEAKNSDGFRKFVQTASPWFGTGGSMQHFKLS